MQAIYCTTNRTQWKKVLCTAQCKAETCCKYRMGEMQRRYISSWKRIGIAGLGFREEGSGKDWIGGGALVVQ